MRWLDLSAHSLKLVVATLPAGNNVLFLEGGDRHVESVQRLGFERIRSGVWTKRGTQFSPAAFIREVPEGRVTEVDPRDYMVSAGRQAGAQSAPAGPAPAVVEATQTRAGA